ncbi:Response regulator of zinc sigma-54-dependent two-component system [Labilithrix luteola]|uniref:Response regulator of zinc sigma-54-dependent two-component system n=1 Tax=Labilithrix luteola TaxID=1391654 RepID=A0A0K1Q376_9BACT|nr:sigma-54 dependent transcriptional regulator [Labilithrix luteola]AKU99814.1 Response regulator of zinc sigma-54-dependent two-component system [Labilithrix luteola]
MDDEANARAALSEILRDEGYATETAADGFKALGKLEEFAPDVVLTDLKMPGLDGIAFMEKARSASPQTVFVVMTAFGTISSAVAAIKQGAENYLTKPLDYDALSAVVDRAMEKAKLLQETLALRERLRERNAFGHIVTEDASPKGMRAVLDLVAQVGPSKASVLITGESGTGKELIAEAICAASPRANAPFVRLHCAALAESLLESELFGHEKGAFTGAVARREGRFKQADGGTLLLDEIGEIPQGTQVKLLRFLQEKSFERVGGNETLKVDVRLIAATNRDLKAEIKKGTFREDLYYRLNVIAIELPPLRARRADVGPLASFFLARYAKENGRNIEGISEQALKILSEYDWPGNVRELENVIERAVVLCDGPQIDVRHLPPSLVPSEQKGGPPPIPGSTIQDLEKYAILKTLEACGGSTSKAANILGVSPRKIQYKLHEYSAGPTRAPDHDD